MVLFLLSLEVTNTPGGQDSAFESDQDLFFFQTGNILFQIKIVSLIFVFLVATSLFLLETIFIVVVIRV